MKQLKHTKTVVLGQYSQQNMADLTSFFLPWTKDAIGAYRPQLSKEVIGLSLDLAATSYEMDVQQWISADWTDVSAQIENKLYTGIRNVSIGNDTKNYVKSRWALYRSRQGVKATNPISQMMGLLRQRDKASSGKVLVMAHKGAEGHYLIAIGFMGTGMRLNDWSSNFRMSTKEGFHQGFLELARQFEENEKKIMFPTIAQELERETLTLFDVLEECRHKESRFHLWLAGHSQGGAVLQVYAHLKQYEDGILPENMIGVGFASPAVSIANSHIPSDAYPLFHIINSDDFVPRMGSLAHLGMLLTYQAGASIRENCYNWAMDEISQNNRKKVKKITKRMVDTPSFIESSLAYIDVLLRQPLEEIHAVFAELQMRYLPVRRMLSAADKREADVVRFVKRRVLTAYEQMTGHPVSDDLLKTIEKEIEEVVDELGIVQFTKTLIQLGGHAHSLVAKAGIPYGSYEYIVNKSKRPLQPSIWRNGTPPVREWLGNSLDGSDTAQEMQTLVVRRRKPAQRRSAHPSKHLKAGVKALG